MHERPLIALNPELESERRRAVLPQCYAERLEQAGAVPMLLPAVCAEAVLDGLLDRVDGLVLAGGNDFDTERLGQGPTHAAAKPVPGEKQDHDLFLVARALERGIPTLGICYGMQCLALATGGKLLQHLPEDRPGSQPHAGGVEHTVLLEANSKLGTWLGIDCMSVVSRHHQALSDPGEWKVAARDAEGLIEAIEQPELPFAVGVQWHPELSCSDDDERLFVQLVKAARTFAGQRSPTPLHSNV